MCKSFEPSQCKQQKRLSLKIMTSWTCVLHVQSMFHSHLMTWQQNTTKVTDNFSFFGGGILKVLNSLDFHNLNQNFWNIIQQVMFCRRKRAIQVRNDKKVSKLWQCLIFGWFKGLFKPTSVPTLREVWDPSYSFNLSFRHFWPT